MILSYEPSISLHVHLQYWYDSHMTCSNNTDSSTDTDSSMTCNADTALSYWVQRKASPLTPIYERELEYVPYNQTEPIVRVVLFS